MLKNKPPTRILGFLAILLILCFSLQSTLASDRLPKGKDYPADNTYNGKPAAQLDRSDEFTNTFRTRFKEAILGDTVFAGEFAQAEWGCGGSGCHVIAFINKRTGRALAHSFMSYDAGDDEKTKSIGEEIVYMNKSSNLIVTYETSDASENKYYNYYTLNKKKDDLDLIKKSLLTPFNIGMVTSDEWGSNVREVPKDKHLTGKIFTQRIERNNLTLRTRIKRLARKTICFSRSIELHEKVIGAFIEKHMFY